MADWLRPILARNKTPTQMLEAAASSRSSFFNDNSGKSVGTSRPQAGLRATSYTKLRSSMNPPNSTPPDVYEFPNIRAPEDICYQPSTDRLVETLKVVMMTQGSLDPVPPEYNASILHALEEYQHMREQLEAKEWEVKELKEKYKEVIGEFKKLAAQWTSRKQDCTMETRHPETRLSETEEGADGHRSCNSEPSKGIAESPWQGSEISSNKDLDSAHNAKNAGHDWHLNINSGQVLQNWAKLPPRTLSTNLVDAIAPESAKNLDNVLTQTKPHQEASADLQMYKPHRSQTHPGTNFNLTVPSGNISSPIQVLHSTRSTYRQGTPGTNNGLLTTVSSLDGERDLLILVNDVGDTSHRQSEVRSDGRVQQDQLSFSFRYGNDSDVIHGSFDPRKSDGQLHKRYPQKPRSRGASISSVHNVPHSEVPGKHLPGKADPAWRLKVSPDSLVTRDSPSHQGHGYGFPDQVTSKPKSRAGSGEALLAAARAVAASHKKSKM